MTGQDKKRDLLIVITRGYASRGDLVNDEFCIHWGFKKESEYEWKTQTEGVALLVIHGYEGFKLEDLIKKAANDEERPNDLTEQARLYYHSVDNLFEDVIKEELSIEELESLEYSSRDGIAVEDLKRKLASEGKKFADAVEMALKGLPVFLFRLLEIQSGLLRLRIILETLFNNNGDGKGNNTLRENLREEWKKTSRKFTEILDLESFSYWFKRLEGQWNGKRDDKQKGKHVDISEALKLLDVLRGESQKFPKCLLADRTWIGYNKSNWYQKVVRMNQKKNVRKDFATFARAVDIVLKEAQTLSPYSPGHAKPDSGGWQA